MVASMLLSGGRSVAQAPVQQVPCLASCSNRCPAVSSLILPSNSLARHMLHHSKRHSRFRRCSASEQGTTVNVTASENKPSGGDERIKQTLADLDALLGIEEEKKEDLPKPTAKDGKVEMSVSPEVLKQIAAADAARNNGSSEKLEEGLNDQMSKIVEQAKRIAAEQDSSAGEQALRKEFDTLLNMLKPGETVPKEDIKAIKEEVFKPLNFWVTEVTPSAEPDGGLLVRGNLRGDMTELFDAVLQKMQGKFGDKYIVLMVDDIEASQLDETEPQARPAFQIVPSALALPRPTSSWQVVAALILLGLTAASSLQVGLVANLAKLPKETLEWLARPENFNSDVLPPGLETWDPIPYISTALPISVGVFGIAILRELGIRIAAGFKNVKLGPAYFIPNGSIGSFGSSAPLKGFLKNRRDLFDLAFAGVALGGGAALTMFLTGLAITQAGELPKEMLVPIPSALFQGSLLLGFLTKAGLGETALRGATVYVHPYLIAGWCGLVGTALNCLPVGSIDGGRLTQAAFGRGSLGVTGFFTYIGLGLGFLGSALSLPFGLYVLICQRTAEKYVQDNLSPVTDQQRAAAAIIIFTAILILLPMAPEVADVTGIGPQSWSL